MAGIPQVVGSLHLMMIHLPIGWLVATVLLDLAGLRRKRPDNVELSVKPADGAPTAADTAGPSSDAAPVEVPAADAVPVDPGAKAGAEKKGASKQVPRYPGVARCGLWMLVGTVLAYLPAVLTGVFREGLYESGPLMAVVSRHEALMLVSLGLLVVALVIRLATRNFPRGALRGAYLALTLAALVLVMFGGYFGGSISHH